jgi:transposase
MPRFKNYSYEQGKMIPIDFKSQIFPGTFEYALNHIVDNDLDMSVFDHRYNNDETGATAYDPAIMLKIILYAYSLGITASRDIESCCRRNVIFMALSADTKPHFTSIANFISSMDKEVGPLFTDILFMCNEMDLIGKEMFAIDGCKLPSNASKEWSGTKKDLEKKKVKIEKAIDYLLKKHRKDDMEEGKPLTMDAKEKKSIDNMTKKLKKLTRWLGENDDRQGKRGTAIKSNITDNESGKMPSSHGVIQGYNGIAAADSKHQVVIHAEAIGTGSEQDSLEPMVKGIKKNLGDIGEKEDLIKRAKLLADSGFHSEANMKMLSEEEIDAYIADGRFRKRDPRFATAVRHNKPIKKEKKERKSKYFSPSDFIHDEERKKAICPAGNEMYLENSKFQVKGAKGIVYKGKISDCRECEIRSKCMKNPDTKSRQVTFFYGKTEEVKDSCSQKMMEKIDSKEGREIYSNRMGLIEPVFAHIRSAMGLDHFTLRGKTKVNTQWTLYCILHNLKKIHRYGAAFT